ncbi:MAG: hypothetical protein Q9164_003388 [Protoblastenia rupestris]
MTSQQHDDSSCDEATSSLGDSAYDFIDDRSVVTTDDEEQDAMTASTASSDRQEIDQIQPRRLGIVTQPTSGNQPLLPSQIRGSSQRLSSPPPDNCRTQEAEPRDNQESIEFDEPSVTNLNSGRIIDVGNVLTRIDSPDIFEALYPPSKLNVTLRQSMITQPLDLAGKSYKVLFVGDVTYKDAVIQKIATALAASGNTSSRPSSPRNSKFNVIPITSFGDEANPEVVLIDSSGLEMAVEECNQATFIETPGGNDILQMTLTDSCTLRSSWDGSKFAVSNDWTLPDIAVFCTSESDDFKVKRTRRFARSFMSRHAVQSIVISETPQWRRYSDTLTLDTFTPHVCLEYEDRTLNRPRVLKRLPVDINTFLRIDAGQMNRNLACLHQVNRRGRITQQAVQNKEHMLGNRITEEKDPFERLVARSPRWFQTYYAFMKGMVDLPFAWSVVGLLIISIGFARLAIFAGSGIHDRTISAPSMATSSAPTLSFSASTASTSASALVPTSSATSSLSAQVSPVRSPSTDTDIASFLLDHSAQSPKKSETFKAHVLGDCHVVMRPPYWFTKLKKTPQLIFKISRKETPLEHKVSTLFEGVYALQIPREEAYGVLNLVIWTDSRHAVNETFEVDFGSSWLKVAAWKRATRAFSESVQTELSQVQTSLSIVYNKSKTELSTIIQKHREMLVRQREAEQAAIVRQFKQSLKTKDLIVTQTKDLGRFLFSKLRDGSIAASRNVEAIKKSVIEELTLYSHNKSAMISRQARALGRAVTGIDIKALFHNVFDSKLGNMRETQKGLLKSWWRIRGLPKHKVVQVRGKNSSRKRRVEFVGDEL